MGVESLLNYQPANVGLGTSFSLGAGTISPTDYSLSAGGAGANFGSDLTLAGRSRSLNPAAPPAGVLDINTAYSPDNFNFGGGLAGNNDPLKITHEYNNWDKFGMGLQGVTSLAGLWNAYEQNKMAKKQFNLSLAAMNRDLSNNAAITNDQLRTRDELRANMSGQTYDPSKTIQVDGSALRA